MRRAVPFRRLSAMNHDPATMTDSSPAAAAEFLVKRNCSIGPGGLAWVFAGLAALSFGFGAVFAALGSWMILPFAGVEMLAVGTAFVMCGRHANDFERISVAPDSVTVETYDAGLRNTRRFDPRRLRLRLEDGLSGSRVALTQGGVELELGRHLDRERKAVFARDLGVALRVAAAA